MLFGIECLSSASIGGALVGYQRESLDFANRFDFGEEWRTI